MGFTINEVQITCIILMGLMSLLLAFLLPQFSAAGRIYNRARKILICGTVLTTVHYTIQYFLHKTGVPTVDNRAVINLLFGFPISYSFMITQLYLQRHGNIRSWIWIYPMAIYAMAIAVAAIALLQVNPLINLSAATQIMSVLYAVLLLSGTLLQFREYFRIKKYIRINGYSPLESLNRWTKWSMLLMAAVAVGLPIMTFNSNLTMRGIYGIFSISVAFFYIFSFIGYGLSKGLNAVEEYESTAPDFDEKAYETYFFNRETQELSGKELERVTRTMADWVAQKNYLKPGLTVKTVADDLKIQRSLLTAWLMTTKYKQFNVWINFMRINEAKAVILKHPDWSNETVAQACGFTNRSYFQRQFREITGMTPSKWEEENSTK